MNAAQRTLEGRNSKHSGSSYAACLLSSEPLQAPQGLPWDERLADRHWTNGSSQENADPDQQPKLSCLKQYSCRSNGVFANLCGMVFAERCHFHPSQELNGFAFGEDAARQTDGEQDWQPPQGLYLARVCCGLRSDLVVIHDACFVGAWSLTSVEVQKSCGHTHDLGVVHDVRLWLLQWQVGGHDALSGSGRDLKPVDDAHFETEDSCCHSLMCLDRTEYSAVPHLGLACVVYLGVENAYYQLEMMSGQADAHSRLVDRVRWISDDDECHSLPPLLQPRRPLLDRYHGVSPYEADGVPPYGLGR